MRTRWLAVVIGFAVLLSTAAFGSVVLTPAYPGAAANLAYKISVDGQPVFVHRFPTFNQFQWMDYGSITMTGKVHVNHYVAGQRPQRDHLFHTPARLRYPSPGKR